MTQKQELLGGIIVGKVIETVVGKALDKVAKSPSISLDQKDVPAVQDIVAQSVKEELAKREQHVTNSEPVYQSRVSQGSFVVILTAAADLARLWNDGIENTPMDYATPAIAIISALWILYGRYVAKKPFGA